MAAPSTGNVLVWNGSDWVPSSTEGSVISPATVSTDQNDYAPTGWATARYVRFTLGADVKFSGFGTTGIVEKRKTLVFVAGGFVAQYLRDDAASTAGNRIITPYPNDVYMALNEARDIWYDSTSAAWRFV
jgi:hypothetical protein